MPLNNSLLLTNESNKLACLSLAGLPYLRPLEKCFTRVGSGLSHEPLTRLERLARDKRLKPIGPIAKLRRKEFYNIGLRPR